MFSIRQFSNHSRDFFPSPIIAVSDRLGISMLTSLRTFFGSSSWSSVGSQVKFPFLMETETWLFSSLLFSSILENKMEPLGGYISSNHLQWSIDPEWSIDLRWPIKPWIPMKFHQFWWTSSLLVKFPFDFIGRKRGWHQFFCILLVWIFLIKTSSFFKKWTPF